MFDLDKAQRLSLTVQVESRLKSALILGMLKPGARLVTKEIAQQLGTSITPVREALLRLVASGALDVTPAQAFLVPAITVCRYQEITSLRKTLEGIAVEKAAREINKAGLIRLNELKDSFLSARQVSVEAVLKANRDFYFQLFQYAAMPTLMELIEQLWVRIGPSFNYLYPRFDEVSKMSHNYDALIMALTESDVEKSIAAIHKSISDDSDVLLRQYIG
ncbi:FCD domain-containing protein [Citrobacter sp. JGM124]|uniref:FCD domain-containing protein n=1 Tax=Citrobacter sp. JGM124 TaxID=2799789 RepID=UPI001BA785FE|nr:FCD domain-containing protein [Citrobacter sp. JGM124]MBS0847377.1 FCD domain-containing protein [Citrobacter sp. JGM124]